MNSDTLFTDKAVSFHTARHLKDKRKRAKMEGRQGGRIRTLWCASEEKKNEVDCKNSELEEPTVYCEFVGVQN